jgi:uncharacterized OsmC-like protein
MPNLRAREAMERAHQLFLRRPSAGLKPNASATATWRDGLRCEIAGPSGEQAVTDMAPPMGGEGTGPNPGWLLRAAMAACSATAIAMFAARRGIALTSLEVSVHSESDARGLVGFDGVSTALTGMRMSIRICAENVPEEELRDLVEAGHSRSPVGCTMQEASPVALDVTVV